MRGAARHTTEHSRLREWRGRIFGRNFGVFFRHINN